MPAVPPENTNYMILGFAVVVIILAALVVYLVLKARSLRADLERLEALEAEEQPSAGQAANQAAAHATAPGGTPRQDIST
jgi:hypothetical protein